jgi:putative ABC transport system ATP-binding protein
LLEGISLNVLEGDRIGLVGPSGAGKTLLLRVISCLDPIDTGSIEWSGRRVFAGIVPSYRSRVIYVHQRPALMDGSVEQNLRFPFGMKTHAARRFDKERVLHLLEGLGRGADFLEKSIQNLSGGEAQLTAIVRAVQLEPDVLLLDEPTASLDKASAERVERLVHEWWFEQREARAMVWVSHDRDQTLRMSRRQIALEGGKIA